MEDYNDKMFQTIFRNSPVGLVIVNSDTTLRDVNAYMFNTFKLEQTDVRNERFGNLFHCVAVNHPGDICGETQACQTCGLRGGVLSVLEDGVEIPETVMDHNFSFHGLEEKKWFKVSASRVQAADDKFAIVSFSDITTQMDYEALLNYQLSIDMATGVTNKHTLLNALNHFRAGFNGMTAAIIDFDNFKAINDRYGHIVGDRVLKIFCDIASQNTRRQDILGRFGGEEFMLVFPGEQAAMMVQVLKRIAELLKLESENELGFRPTFSAGLTEFSQAQLEKHSVSEIIALADANLYEAKNRGKNMIVLDGVSIPL